MDNAPINDLTRRTMVRSAALGVVAVPLLTACGDDGGAPSGSSTPTGSSTPDGTSSPSSTPSGSGGGQVLAQASDIEVGGAVFLDDQNIVITQPASGEFHAFDRTCTHNRCPVTDLQDGNIHCNCHGSLYDPASGAPVGGPAPGPLTEVSITVQGDDIIKA